MPNNILLVYSEKLTQKHLDVVSQIKKLIIRDLNKNCRSVCARDLQDSCFENIDLVITAGGDGTFIRASHYLDKIPILGINSEPEFSEGALTNLKDTEFTRLKQILLGDYAVIKKQRIQIIRNNQLIKELALNEVYVGAENQFHTSRYIIETNNQKEEQRSSGVLIATSSGSNGWYKSAGGQPFPEEKQKLKFLVREPLSGRLFQPKLLHGEISKSEKITFTSTRYSGGAIAIDSNKTYPFNKGDIVEISLSDKPLNVIK